MCSHTQLLDLISSTIDMVSKIYVTFLTLTLYNVSHSDIIPMYHSITSLTTYSIQGHMLEMLKETSTKWF